MTRLPLEPVLALFPPVPDGQPVNDNDHDHRRQFSQAGPKRQLARLMHVDRATTCRWQRQGGVSPVQADRIAVALGKHPAEIWGLDWWAVGG